MKYSSATSIIQNFYGLPNMALHFPLWLTNHAPLIVLIPSFVTVGGERKDQRDMII